MARSKYDRAASGRFRSRARFPAAARAVSDPEDHFYGDRVGTFDDPYGHRWNVATHVEDVLPEEMERRAAGMRPAE